MQSSKHARNLDSFSTFGSRPFGPRRGSLAWILAVGLTGCFAPDSERPQDAGTDGTGEMTQGETGEPGGTDGSSSGGDGSSSDSGDSTSGSDPSPSSTGDPDAGSTSTDPSAGTGDTGDIEPLCNAGEVLGCDGDDLVTCNADGTAEELTGCALGCNAQELRCFDVDPSNALGEFLDGAADEEAYEFVGAVTIDTDTGTVTEDGAEVPVTSFVTGSQPAVRVLVVGGFVTGDIDVNGSNALAIVSDGDIRIGGHFSLSASDNTPGPGEHTTAECEGGAASFGSQTISGAGGGGFGSVGAAGGSATNQGTEFGGSAGGTVGNVTMVPLRGGCNAGLYSGSARGRGGGAAQLVSRTEIVIEGILSANGSSYSGGGSGGGLLIEAPLVEISGNIVANGGAGAGGGFLPVQGEDGRTDDQPASGGVPADTNAGNGGNGAAGGTAAQPGQSINQPNLVFGGHGGGGVGRIRINTPERGLVLTGIASPNPSTGDLAVR